MERILNWNPETDADARYLRSTVPMNDRFSGPLVNEYANKDAKLMGTAIESDAGDEMMNYIFTYWQYLDSFTHWGSPGRGEFVMTPLPDVIDAAHKNGVPISGTQFFNQFEGSVNMAPLLVQDENGKFPAAEQLKKIAEYYGFDGYFINEEASVGQALATKYIQFMKQLQENKPEN
ncbi:MAG: endo-beta-N-acetylglucosaminidase, partial [Oscillospiraceae bacterium]